MKKLLAICSIWILFTAKVDLLSIPIFSDIQDMVGLVTDISDITTGRHDLTAGNLFKKKTDATLVAVNQLSVQISELTQTINVKLDKMMTAMLEDVPRAIQLANLMRKLTELTSRIDKLYGDYLFYVSKSGNVSHYTIEEFGRVVTSHKFGDIPDLLDQTYNLFIPGQLDHKDQSILDTMVSSLQSLEESERCDLLKTGQQRLYDLYETVIITEIKGFTMSTYAFGIMAIYHNESFATEIERATSQTITRSSKYLLSVYNALEKLGRDIFLCDPPKHIKGETHVEINSISRTIVHEEMVFSTCANGCGDIWTDSYLDAYRSRHSEGKKVFWDPAQPCIGLMYNCFDLGNTEFCEMPAEFDRRYSWMNSQYHGVWATDYNCDNGTKKEVLDYTPWYKCSTCFCECSEQKHYSKAIRTFSLRPQLADIENNMVVTGVRFEQKDMIIHVQIEEGKLLPAGQIEKSSVNLKELEDFIYVDEGYGGRFVKINGDNEENLEHGTDYQFIRNKQRSVNLDNVNSQETGYVVTGLKMSQDPENSEAIQLELHITPFNFSTGLLVPTDDKPSKWITHKDMPGHDRSFNERKKKKVFELRRGDYYYDNHPDSEDFAITMFEVSSQYSDLSQSTVPFMDRQLVAASPRVPFDGISLFHRGKEDCGGFLGFKLRTIGLHDYVNPFLKSENVALFQKSYQEISDIAMPEVE